MRGSSPETFGTDHHELVLHEPALQHLAEAIRFTEEPKVNSLQLYLLHRFIGEHVKVVLSGLGGDELFAGYDIYRYLGRSEAAARRAARGCDTRCRAGGRLDCPSNGRRWVVPSSTSLTRKAEWLAASGDGARNYLLLRNAWDFNPALLRRVYTPEFRRGCRPRLVASTTTSSAVTGSLAAQVLRAEFNTKMVSDLLHNEDTMSMAHSVESRVPLLDLTLVRFAARIPDHHRFRDRDEGSAQGSVAGACPARPRAGQEEVGIHRSTRSSSTRRTSARWPGKC